ncbi:hypothetical protein HispidOSU_011629 [Sigmodon hispidus]
MNKKRQHNSGGSLHSSKPSKNPRLKDPHGSPQSSKLMQSHYLRESEESLEPSATEETGGEEAGPAASSHRVEDTKAASDLQGSPEELISLPPSQNSVMRFVPQFAKPKKVRKASAWERASESCAENQETGPELSALQAASQPQESMRFPFHDTGRPEDQTWEDGTSSKERTISPDTGSLGNNDFEMQRARVQDSSSQERHLSDGDAEGKEADSRSPQEGGAQGEGAGAQQSGEPHEEEGILCISVSAPSSDPTVPVPVHTLSSTGALPSCSSPADTSLTDSVIITDVSLDPSVLEQRTPEVASLPGSLDGQTSGGGCSGTLLGYTPLAEETTADREKARLEKGSPGDIQANLTEPAVSGQQEPMMDAGDSDHIEQEMGPAAVNTKDPGSDGQLPGRIGMLPLQAQPMNQKVTVELSSLNCHQDLEGLSLSPHTSSQLEHSQVASDLPQGTKACGSNLGIPIDLSGQQQPSPSSGDQASWQESLAMELDFLPDSQIQDALDVPNVEALPEQVTPQDFPAGNVPDLGCTVPSPCLIRGTSKAVAKAQPRPATGTWAQEACKMQDATDTVRGLVVELSSLNRLIMSTHRDLEAFKRRKAKPQPYSTKGLGSFARRDQGWRDL